MRKIYLTIFNQSSEGHMEVNFNTKRFVAILFLLSANFIYSQSITVTAPNGGETLTGGTSTNVTWTYSGVSFVDIDFSINGGVNWSSIASNVSASLGSQSWNIPTTPATQALVRVKENGGSTEDISNNFFYIKYAQFGTSTSIKVLPLGNSITFDQARADFRYAQNKHAYRLKMWDALRANNQNIDFIGHHFGGYYEFPDPESAAISGIRSSPLLNFLTYGYDSIIYQQITPGNYLNYYTPDVVLLHIGTNDVAETPPILDADGVEGILDLIDAKEISSGKEIWVILARIIGFADGNTNVTTFNDNIENMARARINNGDKILIVDMENDAGIDYIIGPSNDMFDNVHLNDSGKDKMGALFYEALDLILPDAATSAPSITSTAPTTAYVGLPYRYDVDVNISGVVVAPYYSLVTQPSGMKINFRTGIIDWTPSSAGSYSFEVKADNGHGFVTQSCTINVAPQPVLTPNLISYWKMDESVTAGSEATFVDYPGFNDGKSSNSPGTTSGIVGNAVSFSGGNSFGPTTDESIHVMDDSTFYFDETESFSMEAWVKTTDIDGGAFLGKDLDPGNMGYWLGVDGTGHAYFHLRDNISTTTWNNIVADVTSTGIINDNNWHHIVGLRNKTSNYIVLYVDGAASDSTYAPYEKNFFSWEPITFGTYKHTNYYTGLLDEVAIYDKALPINEVNDHYIRGSVYHKGYFDPFVILSTKIYLQGPYNTTNDDMSVNLTVPTTSPYADSRVVGSIPSNIVDWVYIQLRSSSDGSAVVSRSAFLKKDGSVVDDDGSSNVVLDVEPGSYYIVIKHRNHLAVMSSSTVALDDNSTSPVPYNFTSGSGQFWGGTAGAVQVDTSPVRWGMFAGDANGNGKVTYNGSSNDKNSILAEVGLLTPNNIVVGYSKNDTNMDGSVTYNGSSNDKNVVLKTVGLLTPNNEVLTQVP